MAVVEQVRAQQPATHPEPEPSLPRPLRAETLLRPIRAADPLRGWIVTIVITGIAALTRLVNVGFPHQVIFDEVYYPPNADQMLRQGYADSLGRLFVVHPPLGKWCIAIGIKLFGNNTWGWRVPAAIAGTIAVLMLIRVTRRMTGSTMLGGIAGLLLTLDGLSLVQSRISILDIFLQPFVVGGFSCLVIDRDSVRSRLADWVADGSIRDAKWSLGPRLGPRGWRLLGGVLLGASCGVKWNGVYFLAGFAVLSVFWDRSARRSSGARKPRRATALLDLPAALLALAVLPIVTYLATWTGWFLGSNSYDRYWAQQHPAHRFTFIPGALANPLRSLLQFHKEMLTFAESLGSYHPYRSQPWAWIVDARPVNYYYPSNPKGCGAAHCVRQITALGTPALWWVFIPMLLWMLWCSITRFDWRAIAVVMAFLAGWATWLENIGRTMFFFYMTPLVPFLCIGVTLCLGDVLGKRGDTQSRRMIGLGVVCVYLGLVVIDFVWMWPVWTGGLITQSGWQSRMWLDSWI